jgi:predicted TIM-barrel fold metal-dependent hydrolase
MSGPTSTADAPLCLPPRPLISPPERMLPAGTIDTHFHVFEAGAPLNVPRSYTPQILTLGDWLEFAAAGGIARGVLVQPSVYGFDNSVLLRALMAAPDRLRGVVVADPDISQDELERMDRRGVRGVRVNTRNKGGLALPAVERLAGRVGALGWMLQFQVHPEQLREVGALVRRLPTPAVIDHLGFTPIGTPETARLVHELHDLLDSGNCYVKLSAPYRLTNSATFEGMGPVVAALVAAHTDRLLWGSDWPHTELWENVPDDADLIERMLDWVGGDAAWRKVFVTNASDLFFGR